MLEPEPFHAPEVMWTLDPEAAPMTHDNLSIVHLLLGLTQVFA